MFGYSYKGILLEQHKEPALSRELREFFSADTAGITMQREQVQDTDRLEPYEIIAIAKEAGIIDEHDGVPLWEKLEHASTQKKIVSVVADALDDEPYISSQINPLLKNQMLAADGLRFAAKAAGTTDGFFAIYKTLSDLHLKIPKNIDGIRIKRIGGRYPAEYRASKAFVEMEDHLVIGVGALIFLSRAIVYNRPQNTTFITVAGNCIANPTNLELSLGMTITQVLERCGLVDEPNRVVVGGSMTGVSIIDTDKTIVTPITRAILAFREDEKNLRFNCIGCARCTHACPVGLNPYYLYKCIKHKRIVEFMEHDSWLCTGCGTCSYVCPSKLDLSATIVSGRERYQPVFKQIKNSKAERKQLDDLALERHLESYAQRIQNRSEKRKEKQEITQKNKQTREEIKLIKQQEQARLKAEAQDRNNLKKEIQGLEQQLVSEKERSKKITEEKAKAARQALELLEKQREEAEQLRQEQAKLEEIVIVMQENALPVVSGIEREPSLSGSVPLQQIVIVPSRDQLEYTEQIEPQQEIGVEMQAEPELAAEEIAVKTEQASTQSNEPLVWNVPKTTVPPPTHRKARGRGGKKRK